ncbi:MAG: aminotransferase class III-fold pyridoxal phosphate-dependent enzyme, partial [Bradyrhizobium sp.]
YAPFDDVNAALDLVDDNTAGFLLEPVQGEGGIRPASQPCLQALRDICDQRDLMLVFDEVQCGVARTGTLYAYEQYGVTPDIMAVAKGIGGGFPMGACLATTEAAKGMTSGVHGTTFGGNPLAMAVGNAVLDVVLEEGFLQHVAQAGLLLRQRLAELKDRFPDVIEEIRGEGLMLGVKTRVPPADFVGALRAEKLVAIPAGDNVVRLLPPLIIKDDEILEGLRRIEAACVALSRKLKTAGN